jgi:formylglycine-generating enzyme required for sulfatase activity
MLHGTTAAGALPDGASPYGVLDMAGNLMEWTRTVYAPYDLDGQRILSAETQIVVRGGAYYSPAEACRCASRSANEAIGRLTCGLRVALVPD